MSDPIPLNLARLRRTCAECSLQMLCLPAGVDAEDLGRLDTVVQRRKPLAGLDWFVRWLFTPERLHARFPDGKVKSGGMPLFAFAAVKYPLVALLLWALVRVWDTRSLVAFIGGFMLLHLVIVSRALGRLLTGDKVDTV